MADLGPASRALSLHQLHAIPKLGLRLRAEGHHLSQGAGHKLNTPKETGIIQGKCLDPKLCQRFFTDLLFQVH